MGDEVGANVTGEPVFVGESVDGEMVGDFVINVGDRVGRLVII